MNKIVITDILGNNIINIKPIDNVPFILLHTNNPLHLIDKYP